MDIERTVSEGYKVWIALGAVALALGWHKLPHKWARIALVSLTLVGALNYARWGPKLFSETIDSYDVIHYYLGAKYFDELGYYDLYPAALLVDRENGPYNKKIVRFRAQDQEGRYHDNTPVTEGLARGRELRETKFTPERWDQFEADFLYLQRDMNLGRKLWAELLSDRGFNGTPAWIFLAKPIVQYVPATSIKLLCWLDILLLLAALLVLRWAYGWETSVWVLLFLSVTYSLRWPVPSNAFLRYDWVAALLIAMSLIHKGKHLGAGVATAYAALMRFFPAVWMFGPAMKGVFGLFDKQRPLAERFDKRLLMLAAGFIVGAIVIEGLTILSMGFDTIESHAKEISEHTKPSELSSRRVGFAVGLAFEGDMEPKYISDAMKRDIEDFTSERNLLAIALLGALAWGMRSVRDDEAFALGFIPFFVLTTASYYYYVARVTLIAMHAADLSKQRNRVGLAALFGIEVMTNWIETKHPGYRIYLVGNLAWALTAYSIMMAVWLIRDPEGHGTETPALAPTPAS